MTPEPKFPHVWVKMFGENGNTGAIMGRVTDAMAREGVDRDDQMAFRLAVFGCGSYNDVLRLVTETVSVEGIHDV